MLPAIPAGAAEINQRIAFNAGCLFHRDFYVLGRAVFEFKRHVPLAKNTGIEHMQRKQTPLARNFFIPRDEHRDKL